MMIKLLEKDDLFHVMTNQIQNVHTIDVITPGCFDTYVTTDNVCIDYFHTVSLKIKENNILTCYVTRLHNFSTMYVYSNTYLFAGFHGKHGYHCNLTAWNKN